MSNRTPEQLATALEDMAVNPKGGKMAAIAYRHSARLIRDHLGATTQPATQPADVTETAKRIAWAMLEDEDKDRFQTADGAWARIERLGLEGQYIAAARAVTLSPQPDAALVEALERVRDQFGQAVHASLRRAGNSKFSNQAWRAIADMPSEEWSAVIDCALDGLGVTATLRTARPDSQTEGEGNGND